MIDSTALQIAANRDAKLLPEPSIRLLSASAIVRVRSEFDASPARYNQRTGISTTGFNPRVAMPSARPTIFASASGELNTRALPNLRCKLAVT